MSYILDALKKIEHEKNKKVHSDGRVNISGDLFQDRLPSTPGTGIRKVVALIVVVALVACAGTWFALRGNNRKSVAVMHPVTPPPAPVPVPIPVVSAPQPQAGPLPAVQSISSPVVPIRREADEEDTPEQKARHSKKQTKAYSPAPRQSVQAVSPVQAPADIKLSGIAWQDERSGRRAVINGFLLKEGAVVSGAKITDIQADKVRFSTAAGQFEIKLDAVLPAEVKK